MPFPSTTISPRSLSVVASTACPDGPDDADDSVPDEALPAEPASSSEPQPASTTAPTARTVLRMDVVVRMGAPSAGGPVRYGHRHEEPRIRGADGSAAVPRSSPAPWPTAPPGAGQDGGMTAPGNSSARPHQVVVVGPDGQPIGALPMPEPATDD